MIESSTLIQQSEDVVACDLDGGAALLDLKSGDYFRLNQTGSLIWSEISTPSSFSDLLKGFISRFDVEQSKLDLDLRAVLSIMVEKGLVVINPS